MTDVQQVVRGRSGRRGPELRHEHSVSIDDALEARLQHSARTAYVSPSTLIRALLAANLPPAPEEVHQ